VKKCVQCGQTLSDDTKFCFKCGGSSFEQAVEPDAGAQPAASYYQQPTQAVQPAQPAQQQTYQQPVQPAYQQPVYQQPAYQQQGSNNEPVSVGMFFLSLFLMNIPLVNLIYFIVLAAGKSFKKSLSNFGKAALIWWIISFVISIIILIASWSTIASIFEYVGNSGYYYGY
jgi:hypothetical protein